MYTTGSVHTTTFTQNIPKCSGCGRELECASNSENVAPTPGDVTICLHCGTLSRYTDTLDMRSCSEAEMYEILTPEQIRQIGFLRAAFKKMKERN